jgi:hypothetical protein
VSQCYVGLLFLLFLVTKEPKLASPSSKQSQTGVGQPPSARNMIYEALFALDAKIENAMIAGMNTL